jgi:hypothetical protein
MGEAKAGTGTRGKPALTVELTDIETCGRVLSLSTAPVNFSGEAKKAAKQAGKKSSEVRRPARALEHDRWGRASRWGAVAGGLVGVAAAKSFLGNQVAVAVGTAIEFRLARPLSVDIVG